MDSPTCNKRRIVLLGKTGDGKSSAGNTILGDENAFPVGDDPTSETHSCTSKQRRINDKDYTVIDCPGYFDTERSDEELEIEKCITLCSPGPHAFVIVLRVGRYTDQENEVIEKIIKSFGEGALKYAVVLFTFGYQLKGQTIEEFVEKSPLLKDLVQKCGERCHVIDNEHWNQDHEYKSNRVQVEKLLNTIEEMIIDNGGDCYTNAMLQAVEKEIQEKTISLMKSGCSYPKARKLAQKLVQKIIKAAGCATGALLGALLGIPVIISIAILHVGKSLMELLNLILRHMDKDHKDMKGTAEAIKTGAGGVVGLATVMAKAAGGCGTPAVVGVAGTGGGAGVVGLTGAAGAACAGTAAEAAGVAVAKDAGVAIGLGAGAVAGIAAGVVGGCMVAAGAVAGGIVGAEAAENASSPGEAAIKAGKVVINKVKDLFIAEKNELSNKKNDYNRFS